VHESVYGPERRLAHRSGLVALGGEADVRTRTRNDAVDPKRTFSGRRLRKKGVGIGKIARTLGIGASYVQRVVSETESKRKRIN